MYILYKNMRTADPTHRIFLDLVTNMAKGEVGPCQHAVACP